MSRNDEYKKEYDLLGIAAAGVYARIVPEPGSGISNISVSIPDYRITPYFGDMKEGGIVLDKRPCIDHEDFFRMAVSGPMENMSLPAGHKQIFDLSYPPNITPYVEGEKLGGYDCVAMDVYLELWRKMGAKIGKRVGDTIQWENGEIYNIPPASERYSHTECDPKK